MKTVILAVFLVLVVYCQQQQQLCLSRCSNELNQVCSGNKRFWNDCVARCFLESNAEIIGCQRDNIKDTISHSGKQCYCNLLVEPTCFKNNIGGQYLNPCFAHCEHPKSSYKDYKKCEEHSFAVADIYTQNKTCSCNDAYAPSCISGYQFTNICYAKCYHQNKQPSNCSDIFKFLTAPKKANADCVCINSLNPVCVDKTRYANPCLAACDYPDRQAYSC